MIFHDVYQPRARKLPNGKLLCFYPVSLFFCSLHSNETRPWRVRMTSANRSGPLKPMSSQGSGLTQNMKGLVGFTCKSSGIQAVSKCDRKCMIAWMGGWMEDGCMFVCVYARAYVCLHVGMYVYTYACMYVCMYQSYRMKENIHRATSY